MDSSIEQSGTGGGGRRTQQRDTIRRVLEESGRPMAIQEILDASSSLLPGLGQATVYRAIHHFCEKELVSPIELPGEPTRYEWHRTDEHAHFRCDACERTYCIDGECIELRANLPEGFVLKDHQIFLTGLCPECDR